MSNIKFVATKLNGTGKTGKLTPDANGYYTLPLGGLNIYNSMGEYYTAEGAKQLFEQSSALMRRISSGNLKGENGHPKPLPGMKEQEYFNRVMTVEETNVSHHIRAVYLDESFGKNNPQFKNPGLIGIIGEVKPAGPHASALQASFENVDENVCFSIRALSRDYFENRQKYKVLQSILTWDWVTEPGLASATKWDSPALEGFALESFTDQLLTERILTQIIENTPMCVTMESGLNMAKEALQLVRHEKEKRSMSTSYYKPW